MPKLNFSESKVQNIIKFYKNTKSLNKTTKKFKTYSKSSIFRLLKKNNIDTTIDLNSLSKSNTKYKIDRDYFSKIDTRDKAYILGLLFADGAICKNVKQVRLKLADIDLLKTINKHLKYNKPLIKLTKEKDHHKDISMIIICCSKIYNDLIKLGCKPNKTFDNNLPKISKKYMPDFCRGFFDGDGCIYYTKKYSASEVSMISTIDFCTEMGEYLLTQNIKTSYHQDKRYDDRILTLRIRDINSVINFYKLIYKDIKDQIFLKRKLAHYNKLIDHRINKFGLKIKKEI
jgi:intein-encoded DNA endonuclease-like protein